eukprot:gene9271-19675_t
MDVSNPALHTQLLSNFNATPHTHPAGIDACEDDSDYGFCTCARCRGWDSPLRSRQSHPNGWLSDRYARFWAAVATKLGRADPTAWVTGYAYDGYREPPAEATLDGNVLIASVSFSDYPTNSSERAYGRWAWRGWRDAGARAMALRPNSFCKHARCG